ncbi:MAG: YybH family protein [Lysobacteraceae bacterium]
MRPAPAVLLAFFLAAATAAAAQDAPRPAPAPSKDAPNPPPVPALTDAECAVWAREMSFARSVAEHDAQAFADHVGEQAAFGASDPVPSRGRDAIVRDWAGIVAGKTVRLEWYPTRTTIGGVGDIAWSSGPALVERLEPGATPRFLLGKFRSVWHRDADGAWRVLVDDGVPPRPATEAEAAAFRAARPAQCPRG